MIDTDDILLEFNPIILDNIPKIKKMGNVGGNSYVYYDLFALQL